MPAQQSIDLRFDLYMSNTFPSEKRGSIKWHQLKLCWLDGFRAALKQIEEATPASSC